MCKITPGSLAAGISIKYIQPANWLISCKQSDSCSPQLVVSGNLLNSKSYQAMHYWFIQAWTELRKRCN